MDDGRRRDYGAQGRCGTALVLVGVALLVGFAAAAYVMPAGARAGHAHSGAKVTPRRSSTQVGHHRGRHHGRRRQATVKGTRRRAAASVPPLVFGIYPGGPAGTVGPGGTVKPEDPAKRLAALEQLRPPGRPFVLRLYAEYSGSGGWTAAQQVGEQIEQYAAAGFQTELVLTYRPAGGDPAAEVTGFVGFVRNTVQAFASTPGFISLQVTNEANVGNAPNAADGSFAGAKDALIAGVIAAKQEARADGLGQLKIGFNWAQAGDAPAPAFWRYLGRHGGPAFARALDWVGVDIYPGTWGPTIDPSDLSAATATMLNGAFAGLRGDYMPLAGLGRHVALRVSENGFPTGPGRSDAMQVTAIKAAVETVNRDRGKYNITDYRWFDLRDADSSAPSFESHYGLLQDDYRAKPAFAVFKALVARLSHVS